MTDITHFTAKQAQMAYVTTPITWDTGTALQDETFTANMAEVKDMSLQIPEMEYEQILTIGATAQTTGANARTVGTATGVSTATFQNAAVQINAVGMYTLTGTLVFTGDEQGPDILALGTATAVTGGYSRYAPGSLSGTTNDWDRNFTGSFRIFFNNGSETVAAVLSNAYVKLGAISPTGADGYFEREFEVMCLPKDGAIEFLD